MNWGVKLFELMERKLHEAEIKEEDILSNHRESGFLPSVLRGIIVSALTIWAGLYSFGIWILIVLCVMVESCIIFPILPYIVLIDLGVFSGNAIAFAILIIYSILLLLYKLGRASNEG